MTDYYIDAGIAGGNGLSPASAYASVLSVPWAASDRAWVRRTHQETITNSQILGTNITSPAAFARVAAIIGWPNSLDPFFDERTADGIAASWDSDHAPTGVYSLYGIDVPTFSNSNNNTSNGMIIGLGMVYANLCLNQIGSAYHLPINAFGQSRSVFDNIVITRSHATTGPYLTNLNFSIGNIGRMTVIASYGTTTSPLFSNGVWAAHIVVHSKSSIAGPLFTINSGNSFGTRVMMLENYCSSLSYLGIVNDEGFAATAPIMIDRFFGQAPYTADVNQNGAIGVLGMAIDDYLGLGPRFIMSAGKVNHQVVSSADAMFNSRRATKVFVESIAPAAQNFLGRYNRHPLLSRLVSVTSGTQINMYLPVYVDSTAVYSMNGWLTRFELLAAGCTPKFSQRSMVLAGSPTLWSGNLISGGSAWFYKSSWIPAETGLVPFVVFMPPITQATSGENKIGYWLFGEPFNA